MNTPIAIPTNTPSDISAVDALWTLIKRQTKSVQKALAVRLVQEEVISAQEAERHRQEAIVKDSLQTAFQELRAGEVCHDARRLFP